MRIAIMVKTVLTGLALSVALFSAAEAADYDAPRPGPSGFYGVDEGGYAGDEDRRPQGFERGPGYGGGWREGWGHRGGWGWWRHAGGRPWWRQAGEECRVIVKRRVDPWGEVRVKRIEICD